LPVDIQAEKGESGWTGAGILALSLTLLSASPLCSHESLLPLSSFLKKLFSSLLFSSFILSFFLLFAFFFFLLFLSTISLSDSLSISPLPLLYKSFFGREKECLWGNLDVSFFSVWLSKGRNLPRCVGAVQGRGFWPGVPLHIQGLGYDHDRMAAALRSSPLVANGCLKGHPRRLCVPTPKAGRPSPASLVWRLRARVRPSQAGLSLAHSGRSSGKFLVDPSMPAGSNSGFDREEETSLA
jgi:hypothetical protein